MKLNHNKKSVKISLNLFALYTVLVCGVVFALPAFECLRAFGQQRPYFCQLVIPCGERGV